MAWLRGPLSAKSGHSTCPNPDLQHRLNKTIYSNAVWRPSPSHCIDRQYARSQHNIIIGSGPDLDFTHDYECSVRIDWRRRVEGELLTAIQCSLKNVRMAGIFGNPVEAGHFLDEGIV